MHCLESFRDFTQILTTISPNCRNLRGWRGQSNINWSLEPSGVRRIRQFALNGMAPKSPAIIDQESLEISVRRYELRLLDQARAAGHGFKGGRYISDLELLAALQHFGAATRLLDLTHNPLVALWFACQEEKYHDEFGLVVCLNMPDTKLVSLESPFKASKNIHRIIDDHPDSCIIWEPAHEYSRMLAQQSFFVFSKCQGNKYTSLPIHYPLSLKEQERDFVCLAVSPNLKVEMAFIWKTFFGYSVRSLFPDLDGFSRFHGQNCEFDRDFLIN